GFFLIENHNRSDLSFSKIEPQRHKVHKGRKGFFATEPQRCSEKSMLGLPSLVYLFRLYLIPVVASRAGG
ncbi:MAG: hypothetical protein OXH44_07935, partial [Chloroflexi bacterium]|nr:hypothetical protein [Chloroflexota bacterium]